MEQEAVTLYRYLEEARVERIPEAFKEVVLWDVAHNTYLKPRWHQVTGLNLCFLAERTGLYDEQGTGKTLISQAFAAWQGMVGNKVICLMPPVLIGQYMESFLGTLKGIDKLLKIEAYVGILKKRQAMVTKWDKDGWPDILLMTYDGFREEGHAFWEEYNALIMDECRILGCEDNIVYGRIMEFMGPYGCKYGLAMNGTPAKNNLAGLYGHIKFVSPWIYKSKVDFDIQHVNYKTIPVRLKNDRIRDTKVIDSFENVKDLYLNLYTNARRVEKREVLELPAKNIIHFPVQLSKKHKEAYDQFVTSRLMIFDDNTVLDGSTSSAMRQNAMKAVVHSEILQLKEETAVFAAIDEIIEQTGIWATKVFLLCHYRKTVEKVAAHLKKYNPAVIYGGTSNPEKEKNKFLKDDTCRVAVANYVAGGVGLNLQGVCYTAICVEPTTVPGDFDQACDRLHRSGQKEVVNIYVLMVKATIFITAVSSMVKKKLYNSSVVSKAQIERELMGEDLSDLAKDADEIEASNERNKFEEEEAGELPTAPDPEPLAKGWNVM